MAAHTFVKGLTAAAVCLAAVTAVGGVDSDRIRPYKENPYYWQYKNKPVLLLGGSWQDNLFNHPTRLEEHLDLLVSVGGNYVRNTMSHRDGDNVFAFAQDDQGQFNLDEFNEEYWRRFERFLQLTQERDIIVQIEIWDPHDHYLDRGAQGGWSRHPFNPRNNRNYTAEESGLPVEVTYHVAPKPSFHPFFRTVPALDNNERVLAYQTKYVDRLLDHALKYPHVLYCMNNEIGEETPWGDFWATHVQRRAAEAGVTVYTADMRRDHNIRAQDHHHLYDRPDVYTFLDISQVTGSRGQRHYDDVLYVRNYIAGHPRPINNIKNYGAVKHGEDESVARFFRFIFAAGASTRFHRPTPIENPDEHDAASNWGLGLSPRAQTAIRAMREVDRAFDIFRSEPRNDLLSDREDNEAYLLAIPGEEYAVYFPAAGSVTLDVSAVSGEMRAQRIDLDTAEWREEEPVSSGAVITVTSPGPVSDPRDDELPRNVIVNGGFETAELPPAPGYVASLRGWSLGGAMGHIINNVSGPFYTSALGPIPEGDCVYGKQGAGVLSQRVPGLQHGRPFTLSFRVNCREGNEGMDLTVRLGHHILWHDTVAPNPGEFRAITCDGVHDSAWGSTLAFEFSNPRGDATLLLDDVQLWTVPGCGDHSVVLLTKK